MQRSSTLRTSIAKAALVLVTVTGRAFAQSDDVIWHDRYHALLAMSAYGDYNTLCPSQTFTQASMLKNFPDSTLDPWTVLETWGPTASGAEGFTVVVPEMAKVVQVWKGNYNLEKALDTTTTSFAALGLDFNTRNVNFEQLGIAADCGDCTVNAFALQGYLEAKAATNGWAKSIARYKQLFAQQPFYYSITGHGLGGMHSLISSMDLGTQNISFFTHSYGAPRTFSRAGAGLYDFLYGGDETERGIANGDSFVTLIPESNDYSFTNTPYLWYGYNSTFNMNRVVCYESPEDAACMPMQTSTPELDHYFYFANVGQCGGNNQQDLGVAQAYINSVQNSAISAVASSSSTSTSTASSSTITSSTMSAMNTSTVSPSPSSSSSLSPTTNSSAVTLNTAAPIVANATGTSSSPSSSSSTKISSSSNHSTNGTSGLAAGNAEDSSSASTTSSAGLSAVANHWLMPSSAILAMMVSYGLSIVI